MRVADISCGSGSFQLGAYQFLLDWYLAAYLADGREKWATGRNPRLYQTARGEWRLTIAERKRILLDHIYGVDIDPQAVEVTKLSLLLKVLEGEDEQTINQQLALFPERALPDLGRNIKCGNSLIGPDFHDGQQLVLLDDEAALRINVFDWQAEFPHVFAPSPSEGEGRGGGFDVIIGNPPYIRIQALKEWAPVEVEYYKRRYRAASKGNYDIYVVFVEKALELLNERGRLGYILPHKFFNAQYGAPLRGLIAEGKHLAEVVHFGDQQVFAGATTYTCLLFLEKEARQSFHFVKAHDLASWRQGEPQAEGELSLESVTAGEWNFVLSSDGRLMEKLRENSTKLGSLAERMAQGIRTSANEVYVLDLVADHGQFVEARSKQLDAVVTLERGLLFDFLQGREIKAYRTLSSGKLVIMPYSVHSGKAQLVSEFDLAQEYPLTHAYLKANKQYLENRERGRMKGPTWYAYVYPKNIEVMATPKLLVPDIADRASFALDRDGRYAFTSGYGITLKSSTSESPLFVLGLLNSRVLDFYLKRISTTMRGGFFRYFTQYIEQLPIRPIDFTNPADVARHDRMVSLVERMLDLHKRLAAEQTPHVKTVLQRQIEATDRQIDAFVYELYGLTEAEVRVIEESAVR